MFSGYRIDFIINRAQGYLKKHEYTHALEELKKGLEINDKDPYLNLFLGITFFYLKDFDKAISHLKEPKEILKADALPELYMGRVYIEKKEYNQAIEILKKGEKKDKLHPDIHYYLGIAYIGLNDMEKATDQFEMVLAERREFVWARILSLLEWKYMNENK